MSKAEDGETDAAKRLALLRPHVDGEAPLPKVAAAAGIPLRSARRWVARMREGGPAALGRKRRTDAGDRRPDADLIGLVEGMARTRPRLSIATIHVVGSPGIIESVALARQGCNAFAFAQK